MLRIDIIMHILQKRKLKHSYAVGKQQSQEWTEACLTLKLGFLTDFAILFPMKSEQKKGGEWVFWANRDQCIQRRRGLTYI